MEEERKVNECKGCFSIVNKKEEIESEISKLDEKLRRITKELDESEKKLINEALDLNVSNELKRVMDLIFNNCKNEIDYFSAKEWCDKIENNVFILHGKNDSLSPFTESVKLHKRLKNSNLLISELFEHRKITNKISFFLKLKELYKIIKFLSRYYKEAYNI